MHSKNGEQEQDISLYVLKVKVALSELENQLHEHEQSAVEEEKHTVRSDTSIDDELLDIPTIASLTGLTQENFRQLVRKGTIAARKYGGSWVIKRRDVNEYLRKRGRKEI